MKYNKFRFDEITLNYDKKRIPLSAMERTKRQGAFRYFGAQGVIDYVDDYIFDGKYLLIAEDGENLKSKRQNIAQIVEGKFWVNNHAHIVQCNDKCILEYLAYLINGKDVSGYITGSAQPKLSQANLNAMEFDIPSIKEQQDILSILLPIEQKIRINKEINNNLEQQTQAIFDSMFPNITNGENTIGDTITPKRGKGLLSKNAVFGNVPVVAGGLEPSTYHNTANTKAPVLAISASGANAGFVSLWNIPIWSSDSSFIDSSMTDDVYFWYVLLKKRQREIYDSQTGSAQPHIYPQHIAAMPISDLNFDDVRNYTSIVTPIFEMIGHNKDENARLATTRDTLLPKLMSGELDVSDIDL
ncbi:MAG: restriction endonuclease subunit S [Pseudoruminococcus massiliensis]|jgi:restriction endonuclease S subunit|uniref:restriction endonuclease subunit S n=1 Tax=Pseudoruminococcus massiliensis TaxID=2086583 RepID=UPI003995C1D9|nr:restriction endonuclease subunit S [Oscillospiraceae bacterium]